MKWLRLPKIGHDRTVEHYISCALRADAERVKSLAEADGFAVRLEKPTRLRWVITVSHTANPSLLYQRRMERKWDAVAATVKDGHYDGWERSGATRTRLGGVTPRANTPPRVGANQTARPVEDVFAVLTDPTQSPKWSANAIEAELITPGPPGIGSRRRAVTMGPFGRTMENVMEVTELEPNRKVALKLISAPWGGTGRTWYTFKPVAGGTRVDWTWEMEPAGLWKPLGSRPSMALFRRLLQRDLDNLKVMMESGEL